MQEKVSIIVPVYNAEMYLDDCIRSILKQDYDNLEILLVDDGSTDSSAEIAKKYAKKYDYIYYFYQENSGAAVARNCGLEHACGKYIMFVDADDLLKSNILHELVNNIQKDDCDIIACGCTVFDDAGQSDEHFFEDSFSSTEKGKLFFFEQLIDLSKHHPGTVTTAIGVPWGKLYRKSFLDKYELRFDCNLKRAQDNIFNMYAFENANNIYYYDKCLYMYRKDHISAFKNTPEQLYSVLEARKDFFELYPDRLTKELKVLYKNEVLLYLFVSLLRSISDEITDKDLLRLCHLEIYNSVVNNCDIKTKWRWMCYLVRNNKVRTLRFVFNFLEGIRSAKHRIQEGVRRCF